jgi:hypothetical protein
MEYIVKEDGIYNKFGKKLKGGKCKKGYIRHTLYTSGNRVCVKEHRAIALKFVPNPFNKPQVNHIDGNKLNNHPSNLEWVNNSENQLHAYKMGLNKQKSKDDHHQSKLNIEIVREYRKRHLNGESIKSIQRDCGLAYNAVWLMIRNKTWVE